MENQNTVIDRLKPNPLPFPAGWISSNPQKVEEILSRMPVSDQVLSALYLQGKDRLQLIMLSPKGVEVVRAMPPEEIYYMIKRADNDDRLLLLSALSQDQLQYVFDIEWWDGDKFLPQRSLEWFFLLDQCGDDEQILNWFLTDEFDQKVMVLQSLIKVYKRDDLTDDYENIEGLPHFSVDGVYDIFVKVTEAELILKKHLGTLHQRNPKVYISLMEAVIWDILTQVVESAYRWKLARTSERGIPEFEEAIAVYSRLDPEALNTALARSESFSNEGKYVTAPSYPLDIADTSTFFCKCLAQLKDANRVEVIRWELIYLANKVIVADKRDPSSPDTHMEVMRKVLGYINIGLELGTDGDMGKGENLLDRSWLQALFQVGYGRLMQLKWQAEALIKEHGRFLQKILTGAEQDHLGGLVGRFPKVPIFVEKGEPYKWRNMESIQDVQQSEGFLLRARFLVRFSRFCLELTETELEQISKSFDYPEDKNDLDFILLTTTALARYTLFGEVSCAPLPDVAAKAFLQIIFPPPITKGGECDQTRIDLFKNALLKIPITWTDEDKALLDWLFRETGQNLTVQFSRVDLNSHIEWGYTHALLVRKSSHITGS